MEFRKREVKQQKKFRPRQVVPKKPNPSRGSAGGLGPNLGDMRSKIEHEFATAGAAPPDFFEPPTDSKPTGKILKVSFKCEVFEMGDFNRFDMLAPASSIDRKYEMENGTRTYTYPISDDNAGPDVSKIVTYWKPKIEKRKSKFSIQSMRSNDGLS